jgi:class 3 adenylate cyclase
VTVLKADISGSTPLAEKLDPEELRGILSAYFAALAREIHGHGGSVDKYIGRHGGVRLAAVTAG